jgi:hypothetical protein
MGTDSQEIPSPEDLHLTAKSLAVCIYELFICNGRPFNKGDPSQTGPTPENAEHQEITISKKGE